MRVSISAHAVITLCCCVFGFGTVAGAHNDGWYGWYGIVSGGGGGIFGAAEGIPCADVTVVETPDCAPIDDGGANALVVAGEARNGIPPIIGGRKAFSGDGSIGSCWSHATGGNVVNDDVKGCCDISGCCCCASNRSCLGYVFE